MTKELRDQLPRSWCEIADVVDAYEVESGDHFPELRQYAGRVAPQHRAEALAELVMVECERRWKSAKPKRVEDYLDEYPELKSVEDSLQKLARQEYLVRSSINDVPSRDELSARFPKLDHSQITELQQDVVATLPFGVQPWDTHRESSDKDERTSDGGTIQLDTAARSGPEPADSEAAGPSGTMIVDSSKASDHSAPRPDVTIDLDTARQGGSETHRSRPAPRGPDAPPVTAPPTSPTQDRIGRYTIRETLGSGSFGQVLRCHDEDLKRDVAIKIPRKASTSSDRIREFLHEAQSVARLKHPGIVNVLDASQTEDGQVYVVYEYVPGKTLQDRVDKGNVSHNEAVDWIAEIATALHHAHSKGIVHRDIKPANILLDKENATHVADFGLATIDDSFYKDDSGKVVGTIAYMSPEQASGKSHWATPQTDIYALGVMLYHCLTGRLPFSPKRIDEALEQIRERVPTPPRVINETIPVALEEVCLRAMAKSPADRYRTAADMAADLRAALAPAQPPTGFDRRILLGAAAAAAFGIFALMMFLRQSRVDDRDSVSPHGISAPNKGTITDPLGEPRLTLHYWLKEDDLRRTVDADNPLSQPLTNGDRIRFEVTLKAPRYIYVFWYNERGELDRRLWPPDEQLEQQEAAWFASIPQDENMGLPLEGSRGVEMAMVAVSQEPLSAPQLVEFESIAPFDGQAIRLHDPSHALEHLASGAFRESVERGLGEAVRIDDPIDDQFQKQLDDKFECFYGLLIRHE